MTVSERQRPVDAERRTGRTDCAFCGSASLRRTHTGLTHPSKDDHGPFDFFLCEACGSGVMLELPTSASLTALYGSFKDGLPDLNRTIMRDDPQVQLYALCAKRMLQRVASKNGQVWVDVGAGGGELSELIHEMRPSASGIAIDLHGRPDRLAKHADIKWIQADLNEEGFVEKNRLLASADMVISTAVWEHVLRPDIYARELIKLLKPGAVLYLLCPDYGSMARKILGARWPYFTPGEHLNMPTAQGAKICLSRQWALVHPEKPEPKILSRALSLPYSFRYVMRRFGWDAIGRMLPPGFGAPLPAGALETVLTAP